ncbi:hypothetical protein [Blastococcus sp. PRF04-17]|uniref:hypothetical protein n=1 Tax=Blastococcus sp. PRF04-17 TaxID=2933797 RepID=UPI001FF5505A|nr:hypothetical protein [Blastococcus sp. PRF04-17]UOY02759.1 hypothetical protein MVA48_05180 [Blastococcus sp. PRF04-17]
MAVLAAAVVVVGAVLAVVAVPDPVVAGPEFVVYEGSYEPLACDSVRALRAGQILGGVLAVTGPRRPRRLAALAALGGWLLGGRSPEACIRSAHLAWLLAAQPVSAPSI